MFSRNDGMNDLIGGLGAYIISTYVRKSASDRAHVLPPSETSQAVLSLQGPQTATIKDENGNIISARASNAGGFAVLIPIGESEWPADPHAIQAVDNETKALDGQYKRRSQYTGQIVFTINGQEQLTLPVTTQVSYKLAKGEETD
jgi:hypothetical protein